MQVRVCLLGVGTQGEGGEGAARLVHEQVRRA